MVGNDARVEVGEGGRSGRVFMIEELVTMLGSLAVAVQLAVGQIKLLFEGINVMAHMLLGDMHLVHLLPHLVNLHLKVREIRIKSGWHVRHIHEERWIDKRTMWTGKRRRPTWERRKWWIRELRHRRWLVNWTSGICFLPSAHACSSAAVWSGGALGRRR